MRRSEEPGSLAAARAPVRGPSRLFPIETSRRCPPLLSEIVDDPGVPRLARVMMMSGPVCSGFRLEGRRQRGDREPHADEHLGEHVIGGEAEPAVAHLDGRMPIATGI